MQAESELQLSGDLALKVIRAPKGELSLEEIIEHGFPQKGLPAAVNAYRKANRRNLYRGLRKVLKARRHELPHFYGSVFAKIIRANGEIENLGLISLRVVTTAGVNYIVDAFQNTTELENLKFHGLGTGTNAEAAGDTALQTELTTQLTPDSTRATGTTTEGASANIYRTVATNTVDATVAITEHGIFSQAATGGGTLLDRSVFAAVNLGSGDSLQTTYELTFNSGG